MTCAGAAVVLLVYLLHALYFIHYVNDDAYITFRYSRFLALGRGPYFNVDEHVEGYSNFLLMLLLAPIIALAGEGAAVPAAKAVGIAGGLISLSCVMAAYRFLPATGPQLTNKPSEARRSSWASLCGVLAVGLVAVNPSYALNSTSGLETTMFGLYVTAGCLLGVQSVERRRWSGAGVAFAAAALTRPEGPFIFAVYWLAQALLTTPSLLTLARAVASGGLVAATRFPKFTRHLLPDGILVVGVCVGHLIFRLIAYDGEWLPNTYYAKAGGFWKVDAWCYLNGGFVRPFLWFPGLTIGGLGWLCSGSLRKTVPLAAVVLVGCLLPFVTGTDWMLGYRLVVPYLPLAGLLIAIGWVEVLARLFSRIPRWGMALALCPIPILWFTQQDARASFHDEITLRAKGYVTGHAALANWLRGGAAKPGDVVALMDIGLVGYLCIDQRILDITGLTDKVIARSPGEFLSKRYDPRYVLEKRPQFIVIVFAAPGDPTQPMPEGASLAPWTPIEESLLLHPDFKRWYVRPQVWPEPGKPFTQQLAQWLGAERVFEHAHVGSYYLLVVFRRGDAPAA
jgi:hypothetical protein